MLPLQSLVEYRGLARLESAIVHLLSALVQFSLQSHQLALQSLLTATQTPFPLSDLLQLSLQTSLLPLCRTNTKNECLYSLH